ncbi:MAG: hypothetical protein IJU76_02370 [Desulfovibrionaceae bacterium]|nr:hypothetical protein [Desulfovibrionaceae bacterium]
MEEKEIRISLDLSDKKQAKYFKKFLFSKYIIYKKAILTKIQYMVLKYFLFKLIRNPVYFIGFYVSAHKEAVECCLSEDFAVSQAVECRLCQDSKKGTPLMKT